MKKSQIQKIRIEITVDSQSILSLLICNDGTIARHGSGKMPVEHKSVLGKTDPNIFLEVLRDIDERILINNCTHDYPDKKGLPLKYSIAFIGEKPLIIAHEFHLGLENDQASDLLAYFDRFIKRAVLITDSWYNSWEEPQPVTADLGLPQPWWKFW